MDAAYRRLAARGGANVSMTEILSEADLSTRAFYRHFDSKDELLLALYRRDSERLTAATESLVTAAATPREALTRWISSMLRVATEPRRRRRALLLSSPEVARARGYAVEQQRTAAAQEDGLARVLARGRADGSFPLTDPGPDARSIRAALFRVFDDLITGTSTVDGATARAQVTDFALRAVGAREAPDLSGPARPDL
jgi:AcrR family transcriptional regulator